MDVQATLSSAAADLGPAPPSPNRIDTLMLRVGKLNYVWTNTESLLIYLMSHLMATTKETAIVTFLSLNTTRARLDFLDRLAKMRKVQAATRKAVLAITGRLKAEGKLRNKYNHCIYSFNERGELESTQLMRIAEFGDDLRYGKIEGVDDGELARIDEAIQNIAGINRSIWSFIADHHIET